MNSAEIPRVLLLTYFPPDTRYAGGEVIRRILNWFPAERVTWAFLNRERELNESVKVSRIPVVRRMPHWRLRNGFLDYWFANQVQARSVARRVWRAGRTFAPEVIWVLPEIEAVNVGWHLHRLTGLPVHATVFDAHEFSSNLCVPPLYLRTYIRNVGRLLRTVRSADAVSDALLNHIESVHGMSCSERKLVFPPSVPADWMPKTIVAPPFGPAPRKIGLAGAFRVGEPQWKTFLLMLATLPFTFEVVAFAVPDQRPTAALPANVAVRFLDYVPEERDVIGKFMAEGVHACYLGLWKEPGKRLFARTSLSSKLATYLAAGLPVILDGPEDSVAWQLMKHYDAGVLFDADGEAARRELMELFSVPGVWKRKSEGAQRLCRERFDLDVNMAKFTALLARTAEGMGGGSE